MSWIFALTVGAHTWAARQHAGESDASPELIHLARGDHPPPDSAEPQPMPSAVWTDGVTTVTAEEALQRGSAEPTNLVSDPYALLAAGPLRRGERSVEPVDLVAAVLTEAYARAVAQTGADPVEVLLTHPEDWSSDKVQALRQAAYRARLAVDLVVEAVAAASAYAAWGGKGTRVLVVDADRRTAAAAAKVNRVFVVLACGRDAGSGPLRTLVDDVLGRPGVRRELLNDVVLLSDGEPSPELISALTVLTERPPSELSRAAVALGALHYHRALTPLAPEPILPPPPPPPPPQPVRKVNHYAPVKKGRPALVPLLLGILVALVLFELLFIYWPF